MKIEIVEQTIVYNIETENANYTLFVSENDNSYCNYELVDEDGNPVNDEDLLEQITEEINDMPLGFLK